MLNNIQELKEFINWCKANKIRKMKVENIEFEISELEFIQETHDSPDKIVSNTGKHNTDTLADTAEDDNDEDLLFWSSTN